MKKYDLLVVVIGIFIAALNYQFLYGQEEGPESHPDYIISKVTHSPGSPFLGENIDFTVTVKNKGNNDLLDQDFQIKIKDRILNWGDVKMIGSIAPNQEKDVQFTLLTHHTLAFIRSNPHYFDIIVDPENRIQEENVWLIFYSRDFSSNNMTSGGYRVSDGQAYHYELDIGDLLVPGQKNNISFTNAAGSVEKIVEKKQGRKIMVLLRNISVK